MLNESRTYNDYEYCLVHLTEQYPEYYQFFKDSLAEGREVLLDNSIFELGESFDPVKYAEVINELKPTFYIVPDVLEKGYESMISFDKFMKANPELPGLSIGVVQGKTYDELVDCYKYMSENADYIAISFDYSYYVASGIGKTKLERWCNGRVKFINDLIKDGVWNYRKPTHLLGCSLAKEFAQYDHIKNIRSVDTSNPVVAGIHGLRYVHGIGLQEKPSIKLADLIEHEVSDTELEHIYHNTKEFRNIANGY
jgi:hypothetical protein